MGYRDLLHQLAKNPKTSTKYKKKDLSKCNIYEVTNQNLLLYKQLFSGDLVLSYIAYEL